MGRGRSFAHGSGLCRVSVFFPALVSCWMSRLNIIRCDVQTIWILCWDGVSTNSADNKFQLSTTRKEKTNAEADLCNI